MQFIEHLTKKIRDAAVFNSDIQVAPSCILWPDHDRQWEEIIKSLLNELPELLILGDYNPEMRTGPAIWLRCVIAGINNDLEIPNDSVPIIYLPGVSRQDLRVVKNYPDYLKPVAELQYRGVIWSQVNAKDWTILAYLKSDQGGLGLDVSQDKETKKAMQRALNCLLYEDVERLKDKRLDKNDFNTLLTGDPVRDLLQWLDHGDEFRNGHNENEWNVFVEVCESQFAFDPQNNGLLTGVAELATHKGTWNKVWERFCEAPKRYPNIPEHIKNCKHPTSLSWYNPGLSDYDGWPQWNEEQENNLRKKLETLDNVPPHEGREIITKLENEHGSRRNLVWAELGEASLAQALEHLSVLSHNTTNALAAGTVDDLAAGYQNAGWQADDAVMRALACVEKQEDFEVVKTVIRLIYEPWAEESARYLQKIVDESGYPGGTASTHKAPHYNEGECILFVDGLRLDTAKRLVKMLNDHDSQIEETLTWAALPSVTATGKPAVTPVRDKIYGNEASIDFEPCIAESGQSLKGGYHLKKLLRDAGWEILDSSSIGNVNGNAWCEFGNIDHEGHERGWELAKRLDNILDDIRKRVVQLLGAGWKRVHIVTDHGWLLLPGNLPKIELPRAQTETKWGRCAAIKPGASIDERLYPWYWNPDQHFALADGISCFRNGLEYDHGGISLQECLTLELIVSSVAPHTSNITTEITDVVWKGLRCNVAVDGEFNGLSLDIRTQPGNSASSVVRSVKPLNDDGKGFVFIEDEEMEGTDAIIVLLDSNGVLLAQYDTIIGGGI
jgi:hypothetical protein